MKNLLYILLFAATFAIFADGHRMGPEMKKKMWMATIVVFLTLFSACSKKTGLSPEDTALIKGTDRGSFVGSPD